uniref:Imidazoleglycerol-phosphate dehydratase n=1 Tax=Caldiarchaeum subterraneum TaxID=311458 RepID=E6N7G3_CALS0|nr:imidazoleglycerol-phosphate dehydratase [Candidatus Caldarchaeum subterraneum]
MTRTGKAFRETRETRISAEITLDGTGVCRASTGYRFLDHMITTLAKHSLIDITLHAEGDMRHHVVEDTAIVLGQAFDKALGDRVGIKRFGYAIVPMDEALALAAVDLVKRPKPVIKLKTVLDTVEDIPVSEITHFLESFTTSLNATIHIRVLSGMDDHHKVEAAFKALAQAIKQAIQHEPRIKDAPTTKGTM